VNPYFGSFTGWNGALYFEHAGSDLYRTDGTTAGTRLLKQFAPSLLRQFYAGSRYLYFVAGADSALWRSDGTADGTVPLATGGGMQPRYVEGMTELGGRLYLFASGDLVVTDGSASSTRVITKWESDELPTTAPVAAGGMLFFGRNSSVHGIELWRSDGTLDGTVLVKDIAPGATPSGPAKLTGAAAYVFFVANDGTHGNELWRSDGTEAGTILLRDVRAGAEGSNISEIAQVGAFVYFVADDGVHGAELWRSDGTPEGTVLVSDVRPGAQSSMWGSLAGVDGTLYFTADDGVHGAELWRTNAAGGVELVADLAPGGDASAPSQGVRAGRMLYFAASTALGREPWAFPLAPSAVSIDDARVTEGNAGTSIARFTVTRSGDTSASATIAFTTADGSATAGEDYVAASGVLAFAAGESVKTIDVTIHGDTTVELHEAFRVVLAPHAGMPATRNAAFGVIDNDDRRVDLEVQWTPSDAQTSRRTFRITNHGPSAASDVVFRYNESPYAFSVTIATAKSTCYDLAPPAVCAIEPIASGESIDVSVHITFAAGVDTQFPANHHRTIHASVTAVETDTNAANDGAALTMSSDGRMVVPAFLTAGETGPGTLVLGITVNETATVALEAESTNLIPNPPNVIIPPGASTGAFTVTAG
ncbi:MAG TPA: ELWxxDGT repeat protein, partial [Thermoanaerobaculia bacterium]|nr:ELWxxDGT repeat protein [Thermoanaerobaculia bacterium]